MGININVLMYYDFRRSKTNRVLRIERIFSEQAIHRTVSLLFSLMIALAVLWVARPGLLGGQRILALFLLFASGTFGFWVYSLFFHAVLRNFSSKEGENLADHLDFDAAKAIYDFQRNPNRDLSALLSSVFAIPGSELVLFRLGINPKSFREGLSDYLRLSGQKTTDEEISAFLEDALGEAQARGESHITWRDLLTALSVHSQYFQKFLFTQKLKRSDIRELAAWQKDLQDRRAAAKRFWRKENLMARRGIGKAWAAGFTINLDKYASDVTELIARKGLSVRIYGRVAEAEAVERVLARAGENNVVLVGEPGVGKKTIVLSLAQRILEGATLPPLAHKRVLELDVGAVLPGANNMRTVEERLKIIFNDAARAGNIILLIDQIHALFSEGQGAGEINASELLLPYFGSNTIQIIGLTDYDNYHRTFSRNSSLLKAFEKVEVKEPSMDEMMKILQIAVPKVEAHAQVLITFPAMQSALALSDRYIKDTPFPEKALDVLQEAAVFAQSQRKSSLVLPTDIEEVVHRKTEIPVGEVALMEKGILLDLEKILQRRIVGQRDAISAIADALRRSRAGLSSSTKPMGSFLFLGPTGVGKTETARALAAAYFGSEKHMLRFDMSEYQNQDSVSRLLGTGAEPGLLTSAVSESPFSLVLFDEIEKAHPNILNLFLQVFDDGRMTSPTGKTTDFTNTLIIATSNAGAEMIREQVLALRETNLKERLLDYLQKQGNFRPEFLNRFDAIILYKPLTEDQTREVAQLLLADLNKRLKEKEIELKITPTLTAKIAQLGYNPEFGARPLRRVIQDRVENLIAKKLLSGEISRGDVVEIRPEEI